MYCGAKFDKLQTKDQFDGFHGAIFRRSWICFSDVSSASHCYSPPGEQPASLTPPPSPPPSPAVPRATRGERDRIKLSHPSLPSKGTHRDRLPASAHRRNPRLVKRKAPWPPPSPSTKKSSKPARPPRSSLLSSPIPTTPSPSEVMV